MSQKLCSKCRNLLIKKFQVQDCIDEFYLNFPHCHHNEPEEKPKCWCERKGEKRLQVHDYVVNGRYQMGAVEIAQYCPYCGKKL